MQKQHVWDPRVPTFWPDCETVFRSDVKKWRMRAKKQGLTEEDILWFEEAARKRGVKIPGVRILRVRIPKK
jgi:hypothetical protein